MLVYESDYLRILEGGNMIDFVAMAIQQAEKLSVVETDTLRLKVNLKYLQFFYMLRYTDKMWSALLSFAVSPTMCTDS